LGSSSDLPALAAWVFPGQGSQLVGMGQDLFEASPVARCLFLDADSILERPLSEYCFRGPEDVLRRTENTQPAILTVSLACLAVAEERGLLSSLAPAYMAGHSLGEYTAAVAANAFTFEDGLRLVQERGRLMKMAGEKNKGTMAAILGLDEDTARRLCDETGTQFCNLNSPGQIVIGGSVEAVETAIEKAPSFGARRAVRLSVSGAFHTALMEPAVEGMNNVLAQTKIRNPVVPIVGNGNAQPLATAEALREELLYQLTHPVQWQRSVELMVANGVSCFVEFGPGGVLCGLVRRIAPDAETLSISGIESLGQ